MIHFLANPLLSSVTISADGPSCGFSTLFGAALGAGSCIASRLHARNDSNVPLSNEKVRLHSKTVMKMNAAVVVFLTIAFFVVVQNLALEKYLWGYVDTGNGTVAMEYENLNSKNGSSNEIPMNPCQKVRIPLEICRSFFFFQLVYSLFFLLWNALVALVLISVARTHTIDIRRFMRELGIDAHLHDKKFRKNFYNPESMESKDTLGGTKGGGNLKKQHRRYSKMLLFSVSAY